MLAITRCIHHGQRPTSILCVRARESNSFARLQYVQHPPHTIAGTHTPTPAHKHIFTIFGSCVSHTRRTRKTAPAVGAMRPMLGAHKVNISRSEAEKSLSATAAVKQPQLTDYNWVTYAQTHITHTHTHTHVCPLLWHPSPNQTALNVLLPVQSMVSMRLCNTYSVCVSSMLRHY